MELTKEDREVLLEQIDTADWNIPEGTPADDPCLHCPNSEDNPEACADCDLPSEVAPLGRY